MVIAGISRQFTKDTISKADGLWSEMRGVLPTLTGAISTDGYGVWYDVLKGGGKFTYLAGTRVGELAPVPATLSRATFVPLHFAVFAHTGSPRDIRRTTDAILSQWLPKSGRELSSVSGRPDFIERYSGKFSGAGEGPIEIWLPLNKK